MISYEAIELKSENVFYRVYRRVAQVQPGTEIEPHLSRAFEGMGTTNPNRHLLSALHAEGHIAPLQVECRWHSLKIEPIWENPFPLFAPGCLNVFDGFPCRPEWDLAERARDAAKF
jgi:hypothetical protein